MRKKNTTSAQHVVNIFERVVVLMSCIPHVEDPKELQRRLFAGVRRCQTSRALGVKVKKQNAKHIRSDFPEGKHFF